MRERERLHRALDGFDCVVYAASMKFVPAAEYNPVECFRTNTGTAVSVIGASIDRGAKRVVALSTKKASSPVNQYGLIKTALDKLIVSDNAYSGSGETSFPAVRYGNVMGSRGSVALFF